MASDSDIEEDSDTYYSSEETFNYIRDEADNSSLFNYSEPRIWKQFDDRRMCLSDDHDDELETKELDADDLCPKIPPLRVRSTSTVKRCVRSDNLVSDLQQSKIAIGNPDEKQDNHLSSQFRSESNKQKGFKCIDPSGLFFNQILPMTLDSKVPRTMPKSQAWPGNDKYPRTNLFSELNLNNHAEIEIQSYGGVQIVKTVRPNASSSHRSCKPERQESNPNETKYMESRTVQMADGAVSAPSACPVLAHQQSASTEMNKSQTMEDSDKSEYIIITIIINIHLLVRRLCSVMAGPYTSAKTADRPWS